MGDVVIFDVVGLDVAALARAGVAAGVVLDFEGASLAGGAEEVLLDVGGRGVDERANAGARVSDVAFEETAAILLDRHAAVAVRDLVPDNAGLAVGAVEAEATVAENNIFLEDEGAAGTAAKIDAVAV